MFENIARYFNKNETELARIQNAFKTLPKHLVEMLDVIDSVIELEDQAKIPNSLEFAELMVNTAIQTGELDAIIGICHDGTQLFANILPELQPFGPLTCEYIVKTLLGLGVPLPPHFQIEYTCSTPHHAACDGDSDGDDTIANDHAMAMALHLQLNGPHAHAAGAAGPADAAQHVPGVMPIAAAPTQAAEAAPHVPQPDTVGGMPSAAELHAWMF